MTRRLPVQVAMVVSLFMLVCCEKTPTTPTDQLCSAAFTVTPTISNASGLAAATRYMFAAGSSCPSFTWDFGDGSTAQNSTALHSYNSAGTFSVSLTGTNPAGTATVIQTVVVKSMTGTWDGVINTPVALSFRLQLTQAGGNIIGTYSDRNGSGTVTQSAVSDARNVSLSVSQFTGIINLSCRGSDDMNSCTGTATSAYVATMAMTRQ